MKTHLELYGWAIERCYYPPPYKQGRQIGHDGVLLFELRLRGSTFPAACGPLAYVVRVLEKSL